MSPWDAKGRGVGDRVELLPVWVSWFVGEIVVEVVRHPVNWFGEIDYRQRPSELVELVGVVTRSAGDRCSSFLKVELISDNTPFLAAQTSRSLQMNLTTQAGLNKVLNRAR